MLVEVGWWLQLLVMVVVVVGGWRWLVVVDVVVSVVGWWGWLVAVVAASYWWRLGVEMVVLVVVVAVV